jgi:hypothetical protein
VLAEQAKLARAAQVFAKGQALREELGLPPWNQELAMTDAGPAFTDALLRAGLSEADLREAMTIGRSAEIQELIDAALRDAANATASTVDLQRLASD